MKSWTLQRWITRWMVLTVVGSIAVASLLSMAFLRASIHRELDGLAHEEVDEMVALLTSSPGGLEDLRRIHRDLSASHPSNPMGWRLWSPDGELLHQVGSEALLGELDPRPEPLDVTRRAARGQRWRTEALGDGRLVSVAVDGADQYSVLPRYAAFALALLLGSTLVAWWAAASLGRRTSKMLAAVADRTRADAGEASANGAVGGSALHGGLTLPEEIRAVSDSLDAALARIRAESERANLMTAGLAHELRSPLQNLLGEAEVALMRERSAEEYQRVLGSQVEELKDLGRAVDNLVLLCAGGQELAGHEVFDLGDEALLRLDREVGRAQRSGVRLDIDCSGDLEVRGDREALILALSNLVSNAVTWSPRGGVVRVRLEGRERAVQVSVEDEGPGIAPELAETVFEPFQRGPPKESRRVGFGLGLALARTAVELHGGRIVAERAAGGGARLMFEIPRSVAARAEPAPA